MGRERCEGKEDGNSRRDGPEKDGGRRKRRGVFLVNLSGAVIPFYTVQSENLEYRGRERRKEGEMIHNTEGEEG